MYRTGRGKQAMLCVCWEETKKALASISKSSSDGEVGIRRNNLVFFKRKSMSRGAVKG